MLNAHLILREDFFPILQLNIEEAGCSKKHNSEAGRRKIETEFNCNLIPWCISIYCIATYLLQCVLYYEAVYTTQS